MVVADATYLTEACFVVSITSPIFNELRIPFILKLLVCLATTVSALHRRARDGTVGTKHATVPFRRFENGLTPLALVKKHACISGHVELFGEVAVRTS